MTQNRKPAFLDTRAAGRVLSDEVVRRNKTLRHHRIGAGVARPEISGPARSRVPLRRPRPRAGRRSVSPRRRHPYTLPSEQRRAIMARTQNLPHEGNMALRLRTQYRSFLILAALLCAAAASRRPGPAARCASSISPHFPRTRAPPPSTSTTTKAGPRSSTANPSPTGTAPPTSGTSRTAPSSANPHPNIPPAPPTSSGAAASRPTSNSNSRSSSKVPAPTAASSTAASTSRPPRPSSRLTVSRR